MKERLLFDFSAFVVVGLFSGCFQGDQEISGRFTLNLVLNIFSLTRCVGLIILIVLLFSTLRNSFV